MLFPTADLVQMEKLFEVDAGILFQLLYFSRKKN